MLEVVCSWAEAVVRVALGALALLAELTMERLWGKSLYGATFSCVQAAFYLYK